MKLAILKILFTSTNVLCSLTDIEGKVIFWTSIGIEKVKGIKKITSISINALLKRILVELSEIDCKFLYLEIKGFNRNKKLIIKFFKNSSISIISICDKTSFPHNGCRKKNLRRI